MMLEVLQVFLLYKRNELLKCIKTVKKREN